MPSERAAMDATKAPGCLNRKRKPNRRSCRKLSSQRSFILNLRFAICDLRFAIGRTERNRSYDLKLAIADLRLNSPRQCAGLKSQIANLKSQIPSFITQCLHGIDTRGASGGKETGQQCDNEKNDTDRHQQKWIVRRQAEELAGEQPVGRERDA